MVRVVAVWEWIDRMSVTRAIARLCALSVLAFLAFATAPQVLGQVNPDVITNRLGETTVSELPAGPLFWYLETFDSRLEAEGEAGAWSLTGMPVVVPEAAGQIWRATLGPADHASSGGRLVEQVGPLPEVVASEYVLSFGEQIILPGGQTLSHTHPGTETFYVLSGTLTLRTNAGTTEVGAGQWISIPGDTVIQPSNQGTELLQMLPLFVRDAVRPPTSPAAFDRP